MISRRAVYENPHTSVNSRRQYSVSQQRWRYRYCSIFDNFWQNISQIRCSKVREPTHSYNFVQRDSQPALLTPDSTSAARANPKANTQHNPLRNAKTNARRNIMLATPKNRIAFKPALLQPRNDIYESYREVSLIRLPLGRDSLLDQRIDISLDVREREGGSGIPQLRLRQRRT
jgi:hypothetical protein